MKIAIGYNTSHYAWMFRSNLILRLVESGHSVTVISPEDKYSFRFNEIGAKHIHLPMKMNKNPFSDACIALGFYKILKRERIDCFLGYTIKPNIYGSLAAHALGVGVINNIAGLGVTFINDGITTRIVKILYKISLKKSKKVFFQNKDDMKLFVDEGVVGLDNIDLLPGSGIDLDKYRPVLRANESDKFNFLLIARMLWDKGVMEYIEAARIVRKKFKNAEFQLLGPLDVKNPAAIPSDQVHTWVNDGVIDYLGVSDDVRNEISRADCVVLPSYREGTPRTLLEAAAMGKPLIATNAVGCKEVVDHGINGYLCNVRDHNDLAEKMMKIISLPKDQLYAMGSSSRDKVERQFDEEIVIGKYLKILDDLNK